MKLFYILLFCSILACYTQENSSPKPASAEEGIQDIDRYVQLFGSRNGLFSLHALEYIEYFGESAIPALVRGLSYEDPQVRCFSAIALSKFPDKRAIEPLLKLLNDTGDLDLQVLSDDGFSIHSSYGDPLKYAVRDNALRTLQIITGLSFGDWTANEASNQALVQRWKDWWAIEKATWVPIKSRPFSNALPDAAQYPIPDYARYLQGITICIDPGHGGDSHQIGFKRGPTGNRESESNLRLSRYLRDFLVQCGAHVLMTRDSDKFVALEDRTTIANQYHADLFLSIHHNWAFRYTATATTIWYHATPDYNAASMDFARYVFDAFTSQIAMSELDKAMGLKSDYLIYDQAGFAVLRNLDPQIPGILCELAYFSNLSTELKMRDSQFLKQEAYGVFLGIAKYMYSGIPSWKLLFPEGIVKSTNPKFKIQVFDGLEARKEWGSQWAKIFAKHLIVELDQEPIPFSYEERTGILQFTPTKPLRPGRHSLKLWIMNLNKTHNWPKVHWFEVE